MHGILSLLDPSMVLLQTIIEVLVGLMLDSAAQYFSHGSWVGGMSVRGNSFRRMVNHGKSLLEKEVRQRFVQIWAICSGRLSNLASRVTTERKDTLSYESTSQACARSMSHSFSTAALQEEYALHASLARRFALSGSICNWFQITSTPTLLALLVHIPRASSN
jgi:hypothetical protein